MGELILNIDPFPKPRITHQGRFAPTAKKYYGKCDLLRWEAKRVKLPELVEYELTFILPMPKSWSKKKRMAMNGQPHQQKPDKTNLEKAYEDALYNGHFFSTDDSKIWNSSVKKIWGEVGCIKVREIE